MRERRTNWHFVPWLPLAEFRFMAILNVDDFQPDRGFAATTSGGCIGTTCGDPRRNMRRRFKLLLGSLSLTVRLCWKAPPKDRRQ